MSTEAKIKHTGLARLFRERMETEDTHFPRLDLSVALDHIDGLLVELDRNRRLLEAGEGLAEGVGDYYGAHRERWPEQILSLVTAYDEAVKA